MSDKLKPRGRKVKILATLGPASDTPEMIEALMRAGADAFRINMSHGEQADKAKLVEHIRGLEEKLGRPTTILFDLQGPKLRVGAFEGGKADLEKGGTFILDRDKAKGDETRVCLPHPELFEAVEVGSLLLVDDGKMRLKVTEVSDDKIVTEVRVSGTIRDRKGVNVPDVLIPIPALTKKDRSDLQFALSQGADWIALSFVQRPEDVREARELVGKQAAILAKIEKPQAVDGLDEILKEADAVMVARGDLGVELPPEMVPPVQNKIVATARLHGKPVVVATQMLESMITSPTPTRAEVNDVADAIYDGADAVMLSAESAAGDYPIEAVKMMHRIGKAVEGDERYFDRVHFTETPPDPTTADALAESARGIARTVDAKAMVCYTSSGSTARRIARERPSVPTLVMTASQQVARRLGILWGVYAVRTRDVDSFEEMVGKAKRMALRHSIAKGGERIVLMAGVPFGVSGSTNVIHVVKLQGNELETHQRHFEL
ncbi:pyruvate kinase [Sphingomicrobium sediminis]|uniref:Pyruvate kinase n=1 Tax=Sphingomicrobium sediminis TaxID=2950949 RepID=A0A9X2EN40_9SPHN|nr:pyruvate kinase [Sphingomicrobium sediminis]MCM8558434.1 pyruvate kinase [Sphingomicrobium sediminis]